MIYRINEMIEMLLASAVDEETGEVIMTEEELEARIAELQVGFDEKIDSLASAVKNLRAEAESIKDEKLRLAKRQAMVEKAADRAQRFLAYLLNGEKWKNERHNIGYRKSKELILDDQFIEWAEQNAPGLLNYRDPEPMKTEIKRAIANGTFFEHAHVEERNNIQVR